MPKILNLTESQYTERRRDQKRKASKTWYKLNQKKRMATIEALRCRRKSIIDRLKLEQGCMDCGYNKHAEALEFDHRPEELKLFAISKGYRFSAEKVEAEMAKCDLVCANCHRIRTAERRSK